MRHRPSIVSITRRSCRYGFVSNARREFGASRDNTSSATEVDPGAPTPCLKVCIVGSGPSGFYTAKYLQQSLATSITPTVRGGFTNLQIDILDKLPTPYGLVRFGVAPDHPEVKNVEHDFAALLSSPPPPPQPQKESRDDNNNSHDNNRKSCVANPSMSSIISFMGNVHVGVDISLNELRQFYHVVVLAYGCADDRKMGIQGETTLHGIFTAREFVAWYNGHPDFVHLGNNIANVLSSKASEKVIKNIVIIGHGNVALDCARVLAKGKKGLIHTDITNNALDVLSDDSRNITIVGRRGHVQGAFTIKEIRELTKLEEEGYDATFHIRQDELDLGMTKATLEELQAPVSPPKVRIDKLLHKVAAAPRTETAKNIGDQSAVYKTQVHLRFLLNPKQFIPKDDNSNRLGAVLCERTFLDGPMSAQVAKGTGEMETILADMALVSIGYRGVPLPGMNDDSFDSRRGILRNEHGKVFGNDCATSGEEARTGLLYAAGWIKRGPTGIIGTNIGDARDTVGSILHDLKKGRIPVGMDASTIDRGTSGRDALAKLLHTRNVQIVDWDGFQRIDEAEKDLKSLRTTSQPREKIVNIAEMLKIARSSQ